MALSLAEAQLAAAKVEAAGDRESAEAQLATAKVEAGALELARSVAVEELIASQDEVAGLRLELARLQGAEAP